MWYKRVVKLCSSPLTPACAAGALLLAESASLCPDAVFTAAAGGWLTLVARLFTTVRPLAPTPSPSPFRSTPLPDGLPDGVVVIATCCLRSDRLMRRAWLCSRRCVR